MKKPVVLAVLGLAGVALAALPTLGQGPDRPRPEGPPPPGRASIEREAGLTDAQADQLRQLRQTDMKLAIRRRAELKIARMELDELFAAATVDEKAVAAKAKALGDLEAAALKAGVDHRLAVRRIVSAEQFEKMRLARPRGPGEGGRDGGRGGHGRRGPGFGPPSGSGGGPGGPPSVEDEIDDLPDNESR